MYVGKMGRYLPKLLILRQRSGGSRGSMDDILCGNESREWAGTGTGRAVEGNGMVTCEGAIGR